MYSIVTHGAMIADRPRTEAYCEALRQVVKPGDVVLDIGTGAGIFALLACRFGARKVYAVEPSDAIEVAREIAAANQLTDRIEFIQDLSTSIALPEPAHVIVSDLRGALPLFGHHLPSIIDARDRLLVSGGTMIPRSDLLWAAVVEAPELYSRFTGPWGDDSYGFDLTAARPLVTNACAKGRVKPEQLLAEPKCWAQLDYQSINGTNVRGELTSSASREGTAHGLNIWFDATLADGVTYSTSPMGRELIYGSLFFPFSRPVALTVADTISVVLEAKLVGDDYIWRWSTCVVGADLQTPVKATFQQSTFFGTPLSTNRLHKRAANYAPCLGESGQIDRFILDLMDGTRPLDQLARTLGEQFPRRFGRFDKALSYVSNLSAKYAL